MGAYFDLHCDTLTELYKNRYRITDAPLRISLQKNPYFPYRQVGAIWCDRRLSDEEAFLRYREVVRYAKAQPIPFLTDVKSDVPIGWILAVEDARLLGGKIERLSELHRDGVRFLTLCWKGTTCIGGGFDTEEGLTDFGRETVLGCFRLGILPDISHASEKTADEVFDLCEQYGKTVLASHSNAYEIHPHPRNLRKNQFARLRSLGGIVGISMAPEHLSPSPCGMDAILRHIDWYLCHGGAFSLCFGCDFDGTDSLPEGIDGIGTLYRLTDEMARHGISDAQIQAIFYGNAMRFCQKFFN